MSGYYFDGFHFMGFGWILLFFIILIIIYIVKDDDEKGTAKTILDERYAKGEIEFEEYNTRKKNLKK